MPLTATRERLRIASHGKRLFAFILDFAFALLLVNTFNYLSYPEHWDLQLASSKWRNLTTLYLGICFLLLCKDGWKGCSPGKFIFGITVRQLEDLSKNPSVANAILRNLSLLILPLEGLLLLMDSHGRRLGDRWLRTVVIENPNPRRFIIRLMTANTIFFGYFFSALLIQPLILKKTAAYQTAISYLQNTPEVVQQFGAIQDFKSPEMDINIREEEGSALVYVQAVSARQIFPVTIHLQLVDLPKRAWQPQRLEIGSKDSQ